MSNTVVGFTIQIDGIQSINQLNAEIKQTKEAMNALDLSTEEGNKAFQELSQTLGKMTAQQKALKKAQDDVNKSFLPEKAVGAYDQLSAKLNKLRKEFKNAALDGSKTTEELDKMQKEIQQLDKTLKNVDGQVGQFQRNVGNYPRTFQRVTRSLQQAIPGFEAFSQQLRNSEGGLSTFGKALIGGFLAFQAANLIGKAIGQLDEFNKKITETRNTVMGLSGAFGSNLDDLTAQTTALAETFNTDAKTIGEAAKALAGKLGISFEEALGKLEGALVEGRGNTDDYLNKIKEIPAAFQEAGTGISDLSEDNKRLLDSNKELAISQIRVAKETKEIVTSFKELKNAVTGQLIKFVVALYDALKPIGMAFYDLGKAVYNFIAAIGGIFTSGGQAVSVLDLFGATIRFILSPIQFLIGLVAGVISVMTQFAPILLAAAVAVGTFTLAINAGKIAAALYAAAQYLMNGAVAAYTVITKTARAAQLAFNAAVKANPIGLAITGLVAAGSAVAAYAYATSESTDASKANTTALSAEEQAIIDKAEAEQKAVDDKMKAQQEAFQKEQKIAEDKRKADEAAKAALDKYNQAVEKLSNDRTKFLESELSAQKNALALLADLRARYIDEQIKSIKDDQERQIKEIEIGTERQVAALNDQLTKLQEENQARAKEAEAQLKEAIKLNVAEVGKIREENLKSAAKSAEEEKKLSEEIARLKIEIEKNAQTQIDGVKAEARSEELAKAKEQAEKLIELRNQFLSEEIEYIEQQGEFRELKNQETLNRLLAQEKDAKKREEIIRLAAEQETIDKIANIRNQIQAFNDAEAQILDENGKLKVGIVQSEYDAILLARQKLFTDLSAEEKKQTDDVANNSAAQTKIKQDQFNEIADYFKQGLDALSEVFDVVNERQQAAFDADIERSQLRQETLQGELENSTGLRRRYYEQQLAAEVANQAAIEKAKEEARKRDAKRQKAIAIIQSIINTALAVTAALTAGGNPLKLATGAQIFEAAIIGALGAIQTGIIAAQPLARGGVVGLGDEIVQFANGGTVTSRGNIKPLSNGDNVLATLKTGEVVLNKEQQGRIGYSTLKAARIPNFAMGGVVGAPSGFLQDSLNRAGEEQNRLKVMQDLVLETQGRIDRLQVIYTASTDDDVEKGRSERKEIRATASF
jgi:hypothetical protein